MTVEWSSKREGRKAAGDQHQFIQRKGKHIEEYECEYGYVYMCVYEKKRKTRTRCEGVCIVKNLERMKDNENR